MKIYYVENLTGFNQIEQFYVIDFEFGFLAEFSKDGSQELTYKSWSDFYSCWDRRGKFEKCPKHGKEQFKKHAVLLRLA
jgi:hypothetical protein